MVKKIDKIMRVNNNKVSLLLEVATSIEPIRNRYASDILEADFYSLMSADPTFNRAEDKMGKYWRWILTMYRKEEINPQNAMDLENLRMYLTLYAKFKQKIEKKNIEQIKSVDELRAIVEPYIKNPNQPTSKTQEIQAIKIGDSIKVYEDDTWLVVIPITRLASIQYGKHTKWCTAATKAKNIFDDYNDAGNLYIFINKSTNQKYQYFIAKWELKDELKNDIREIPGLTPGAKDFFDRIPAMEDIYSGIKDEMLMNKIKGMLSPEGLKRLDILDSISYSETGLFPVTQTNDHGIELKNFMDINGNFLSDTWFNDVRPFTYDKDYAIVTKNGRQNIIFTDGRYLFSRYVDGIFDPADVQVQYTDDPIIITTTSNGKRLQGIVIKKDWELGNNWFDEISQFDTEGVAEAKFNGRKVRIDRKGNILDRI